MNNQGKVATITTSYQHFNRIKCNYYHEGEITHKGAYLSHHWSRSFRHLESKILRWRGGRTTSMFMHHELDCTQIALDESILEIIDITELLYSQLPRYPDFRSRSEEDFLGTDSQALVTKALLEQLR